VARLRELCNGLPDDAQTGQLRIPAPLTASPSTVDTLNLHLEIPFVLPVVASTPAFLRGALGVEVPLIFEVSAEPRIRLQADVPSLITGTLTVSPLSEMQPRSEQATLDLAQEFTHGVSEALFLLIDKLTVRADVSVGTSFPNSRVVVTQVGAATIRHAGQDLVVVGVNVVNPGAVNPDRSQLLSPEVAAAPDNLHVSFDEAFAGDALDSVIKSGDLATYLNDFIDRHSPVTAPRIVVNSGSVTFEDGDFSLAIDCVAIDACPFNKDLAFTASVNVFPRLADGVLDVDTSEGSIDLDDVDTVLCTLLGGFHGPLLDGLTTLALVFIARYSPAGKDTDFAAGDTSPPLPGTEVDVRVRVTNIVLTPGQANADALAELVVDSLRTFVYLRITTRTRAVRTTASRRRHRSALRARRSCNCRR
jgi:hypothetical protein